MNLYTHQQKLVDECPQKHLLMWNCGTGKTPTLIKMANKVSNSALVICPKMLKTNWLREIKKWSRKDFIWDVMSKEEFRRDYKKIEGRNCVIMDEMHFMANYKSQLHKAVASYLNIYKTEYIYGATATPYLREAMNTYSLGKLFGKEHQGWTFPKFQNRFYYKVKMGGRRVPMPKKDQESKDLLVQLTQSLGSTIKLEDCADVPESVFRTEYFDLTKKQEKAIKEVDDITHIVYWTKVHQICGGTLKGDEYNVPQSFDCQKLDRIVDLTTENPKMAIVARYNGELYRIQERLKEEGIEAHVINGKTPLQEKDDIISKANNTDTKNIVILIQAACSEGYNLTGIPTMVFYSHDFSLKNWVQMIGRIQRINALQKCLYISLVVQNNIDEDVYDKLQSKKDFQIKLYNN